MKKLKYLSTLIIAACAIIAAWLVWNYYTQSPWTRDGKIRAEQVGITPQVSGSILQLNVKDNQLVNAGDVLFRIDDTPYRIAVLNAQAQLAKAKAELAKAKAEQTKAASDVTRRRSLSQNFISAEDMETVNTALNTANTTYEAAKAVVGVAQAALEHAQWQLTQTVVKAPVDGWITNLSTRVGDYASVGHPVFALVDSHSFYVWVILKRPNYVTSAKVIAPRSFFIAANKRYRVTFPALAALSSTRASKAVRRWSLILNPIFRGCASRNVYRYVSSSINSLRMSHWFQVPPVPCQLADNNEAAGSALAITAVV